MKIRFNILAICVAFLLSACGSVQVTDYKDRKPRLDLKTFFDGDLKAYGIVKNRSGKVIRTFKADIVAYWQDERGTLEEDFVFDDGEEQRRVWTLVRQADGSYKGTAGDVIGEADGATSGNSMFLEYILDVPYKDDSIEITIDDRMYLLTPDLLINESVMTKFGFRVGEIVLVIQKEQP
jgi:major membrane immunogen (membrane-anchored lipoprotein)